MQQKPPAKFVADLMNHSRFGPLAQTFVLEAITQRAQHIAKVQLGDLQEEGVAQPELQQALAKEFLGKIALYYGLPEMAPEKVAA